MATGSQPIEDPLTAGHEALAEGAWAEARKAFETAVASGPGSAEAWEGLGWAAWWLADGPLTLQARERAYRAYRAAGDRGAAARVAAWLASDFLEFRGEAAIASGWLERARRLLDGVPRGPDHGWVCLHEGSLALSARGDAETAIRLAAEATAIGRELGVADLEAVGLAQEGVALVIRGHVEDGMRRLDEASAIASHEDLELPISLGWALCYLITACEGVGDFPRAAQWCEITRTFAERWGARQLIGICRSAYGRVLATGGDWVAAEAELTAAVGDLAQSRPGMAGGGLVRLGELRVRQGRPAEARELFERAGAHPMALLGLGDMALDAGDAAAAAHAAERILRRLPEGSVLHQVPALELLVRARSASGEYETAAAACAELDAAGALLGTPYVLGRVRLAAGELAAAQGEHDEARRACEDAIDRFSESSAPYDGARARLALARALAALGHRDAAAAEARAARETFAALGAARDVERADAPLAAVAPAEADALGDLTARELDVLRLVAQGLSDAEIAARLFLSPHTVHRHVANTRAKLRLPSRAAAVAYASRAGLL